MMVDLVLCQRGTRKKPCMRPAVWFTAYTPPTSERDEPDFSVDVGAWLRWSEATPRDLYLALACQWHARGWKGRVRIPPDLDWAPMLAMLRERTNPGVIHIPDAPNSIANA
jgi:hypothetical protein